jgi:lipoprotein LprG
MRGLRTLTALLAAVIGLSACGSPPPKASTLLRQSSQHMLSLKGFHFQMNISGYTGTDVPVQSATGEAHPPNLRADANLKEGGLLLEIQVVYADGGTYFRSFTGGWQKLSGQELAQFFDPRALFDQQSGLFAVMTDTRSPVLGNQATISGHDTYPVDGTLSGSRIHQLLNPIVAEGNDHVTYWIQSDNANLWRARLSGNLFDVSKAATVTFDFSKHDQPVTVTPPALG